MSEKIEPVACLPDVIAKVRKEQDFALCKGPHAMQAREMRLSQIVTSLEQVERDHATTVSALEARIAELTKALERIARPNDCGCKPCTSTCRNQIALEIMVDAIQELARDALAGASQP